MMDQVHQSADLPLVRKTAGSVPLASGFRPGGSIDGVL